VAQHRLAMIVLEGTFVLDLAVAAQAFGQRPSVFSKLRDEPVPPYQVGVCGRAATPTSLGFTMSDLKPLEWATGADTLVVPGLEAPWLPQDEDVLAVVAGAAAAGSRLVSLCAGAFVLGQAGVLDGRRVTTHWALAEEFRALFPRACLVENEMYVDDGQVLSSGGMMASADLCLYLLGQDHGQAYANDVSRVLISPPHRTSSQAQYVKAALRPSSGTLGPVLAWIDDHLSQPIGLQDVAAHAHRSERTLERQFQSEVGTSVAVWIAGRRVARAKALLEDTDLTVSEVAFTAGFGSTESLRRHFRAEVGTTPRSYRQTFRDPRPSPLGGERPGPNQLPR
jgi:transcriptional regulator GlxA family with amidase domain